MLLWSRKLRLTKDTLVPNPCTSQGLAREKATESSPEPSAAGEALRVAQPRYQVALLQAAGVSLTLTLWTLSKEDPLLPKPMKKQMPEVACLLAGR